MARTLILFCIVNDGSNINIIIIIIIIMKLNVIASNVHENFTSTLFSPGNTILIRQVVLLLLRRLRAKAK